MTFDATLNPVVYEGGIPVFIDTERDSWNIDKLQGRKIMHFNAFILGKGIKVPQDKLCELVYDYKSLRKTEFENKYYSKERKRN